MTINIIDIKIFVTIIISNTEDIMNTINNFFREDAGVTAIEYGLIAALIAVVIIGAVTTIGTNLNTTFTTIAGKI